MPNDCSNRLIVKGTTSQLVDFIKKYCTNGNFDFNKVIPEPTTKEECDPSCLVTEDSHIVEDTDKPWFDWYKWHCKYWDTKWNAYNCQGPDVEDIEEGDATEIELWFDTAWSPCESVICELIEELEPTLEFQYYYYEPGCAFGGGYDEMGNWFDIDDDPKELRQFSIDYEFESPEYWDEWDEENEDDEEEDDE